MLQLPEDHQTRGGGHCYVNCCLSQPRIRVIFVGKTNFIKRVVMQGVVCVPSQTQQTILLRDNPSEYLRPINPKKGPQKFEGKREKSGHLNMDEISKLGLSSGKSQMKPAFQKWLSSCWFCDNLHFVCSCQLRYQKCESCGQIGQICTSNQVGNKNNHWDSASSQTLYLPYSTGKYITISTNGYSVSLQIDTASDITALSQVIWKNVGSPQSESTLHMAQNVSEHPISFLGELLRKFTFCEFRCTHIYYVAGSNDVNPLELYQIKQLHLWDVPVKSV